MMTEQQRRSEPGNPFTTNTSEGEGSMTASIKDSFLVDSFASSFQSIIQESNRRGPHFGGELFLEHINEEDEEEKLENGRKSNEKPFNRSQSKLATQIYFCRDCKRKQKYYYFYKVSKSFRRMEHIHLIPIKTVEN